MSYFRESGSKRIQPSSDAEDGSDQDDDETEEDEPWVQGRRKKVPRYRTEVNGDGMDGLVFGGHSWMAPPDPVASKTPRGRKRRADGQPKRWFFQKNVGDDVFSSQIERAVALRQNALSNFTIEDTLDTEDGDVGDVDEMDDPLERGSVA